MNEHLSPIFEKILPAIEMAGISYWIFGGTALAGIEGRFIRTNKDVDMFVVKNDYKSVITIAERFAASFGWRYEHTFFKDRDKREFFPPASTDDIFSIIPVYQLGDAVRFVFQTSTKEFSLGILDRQIRNIAGYTFTTPDTRFVKQLFLHNVDYLIRSKTFRDRPSLRHNTEIDRKVILNDEEWNSFLGRYSNKYLHKDSGLS